MKKIFICSIATFCAHLFVIECQATGFLKRLFQFNTHSNNRISLPSKEYSINEHLPHPNKSTLLEAEEKFNESVNLWSNDPNKENFNKVQSQAAECIFPLKNKGEEINAEQTEMLIRIQFTKAAIEAYHHLSQQTSDPNNDNDLQILSSYSRITGGYLGTLCLKDILSPSK